MGFSLISGFRSESVMSSVGLPDHINDTTRVADGIAWIWFKGLVLDYIVTHCLDRYPLIDPNLYKSSHDSVK